MLDNPIMSVEDRSNSIFKVLGKYGESPCFLCRALVEFRSLDTLALVFGVINIMVSNVEMVKYGSA